MAKQIKVKQYDHPGRPRYEMKFPRSAQWTFSDLMEVNGVETNPESKKFGKGPNCTQLTLRKNLEVDMYRHKDGKRPISANRTNLNPKSHVVLVKGVTAEPNSDNGLGRRALLYSLRAKADTKTTRTAKTAPVAAVKTPRTPRAEKSQTPTADVLDKIHEVLAAPSAPVLVPAVDITPAPAAEPVAAPVETAKVEETAPVAS